MAVVFGCRAHTPGRIRVCAVIPAQTSDPFQHDGDALTHSDAH
jgi:hypothetical protein